MANSCNQNASGICSEAEGNQTTAAGFASHVEGVNTVAAASASHAEGLNTVAEGTASHTEGYLTTASEATAHAEGYSTTASGFASHAEGLDTVAMGTTSHAEGRLTFAGGTGSHAEGFNTQALNLYAHSEGNLTTASGIASHSEGENTIASGLVSHAEGQGTQATGESSHAEGDKTEASGRASHAEGNLTVASGVFSHTEGQRSVAVGDLSHAEGNHTQALGQNSHAEGALTIASGFTSHAEGVNTIASGLFSHTQGQSTDANFLEGVHVMGKFGAANELSYSWYLANGTDSTTPSLAAKVLSNGNVKIDGTVMTPAADFAEMFETIDRNPIDFGFFVTLEEDKVRIANGQDDFILGITSANPAFLADSGELRWEQKYVTTEWGELLYENVTLSPVVDDFGNVILPSRIERRPLLNPDWDATLVYQPRSQRTEWVAIGLLGKLLVRDNGLCKTNSYCKPNDQGIAEPSDTGFRVLKRTGPNQILILFK
jgi:trimeric autotransporter adhesin